MDQIDKMSKKPFYNVFAPGSPFFPIRNLINLLNKLEKFQYNLLVFYREF